MNRRMSAGVAWRWLLLFLCVWPGLGGAQCRFLPVDSLPLPCEVPALAARVYGNEPCRLWVDSVMGRMSLKERIGQLFIYTIAPQTEKANRDLLRKVVREYKVGGLLFSGGKAHDQAVLTNEAQQMADVPLLVTFDGEWGLGMRLKEIPSFPRNMVLGCIRNDTLLYEYGREVARQCREMGVQVNFAPVADVNINPENPVINTRSFGEDPEEVARRVVAYARGLESGGVLSVCKHFPGHGDTNVDSHKALPVLPFTRERLDSVELYPFRRAIRAGLGGMMVGHLEVPALEEEAGLPASLSHSIVTGLLQEELGFRGLVFTDALAMRGVAGHGSLCLRALQAGHDLLLAPRAVAGELEAVWKAVRSGELPEAEIDRRCRKVLAYKYALGLTRRPHIRLSGLEQRLETPYMRDLIARLKQASLVVAGDAAGLLPLGGTENRVAVLQVGGAEALSPFMEELSGAVRPAVFRLAKGMTDAALQGLQQKLGAYSCLVVCLADRKLEAYRPFFARYLPEGVPTVYVNLVSALQVPRDFGPAPDVLLQAHQADEYFQRGAAAVLTGRAGADGRLAVAVGSWFAAGEGVDCRPSELPARPLEALGVDAARLAEIDRIAQEGIREGAYPGCQVVVWKDGQEIYNKAFGTHRGGRGAGRDTTRVRPSDVYDIASLTKTSATLLAVMKLYDRGRISLTDRAADYLPYLRGTDKRDITLKQILFHESGLPSTILFYQAAIDSDSYEGPLFRARRDAAHTARIGRQTWANASFRYRDGLVSPVPTDSFTMQVCDSLWLLSSFKGEYLQQIADAPLLSKRYRYSCVGFILLQQMVERLTHMSMDAYLEKTFYAPMGLSRTLYLPLRRVDRRDVVPSARDPFLRKGVLQGYVHDESAAFLGGVSGNAGLFSTAREVAQIFQMLLDGGMYGGRRYLSESTCRLFTTTVSRVSRRGLGFDKPDKKSPRRSPCAPSAPASVYGHTGFTGTCAWVDPDNRLVFVFLCNRTYPDPWNSKLTSLDLRPRMQEMVYKSLNGK